MKQDWKREREFIEIPRQDVIKLFKNNFHFDVKEISLLQGGLRNSNYKITFSNSQTPLVLRIMDDKHATEQELIALSLIKGKVPAPSILYSDLTQNNFQYFIIIETFIPGISISHLFNKSEDLSHSQKIRLYEQSGQILAQIHSFSSSSQSIDQKIYLEMTNDLLSGIFLKSRLESSMISGIKKYISDNLILFQEIDANACLIHADFNFPNIFAEFRDNNWIITGILDWEFSFYQSNLFDLGNFLRYEKDLSNIFVNAFISAYKNAGGIIPTEWKRCIRFFDLIALLQMLNREECSESCKIDLVSLINRSIS